MIAHGAEHARLRVVEGHVIRKTADVQFGVVMTARIAATDEHTVSTVSPHVGQRHGLVVKQKVRDCPGHAASKRGLSGSALVSGPVVSRVFRQKRGVLAEIGHSQIKIEPLCNEAAPRPLTICGGETCPQPTCRPATSPLHRSARRGRLARE